MGIRHLGNQRKNEEISILKKDKSTELKSLTDKQKKKPDLQSKLNKEEQEETLTLQQQITRGMEKQKMQLIYTTK